MSTNNQARYVVYMPINSDAEPTPFYVPDDADVEALAGAIHAYPDFKHHLEHETLRLYKVVLR